MTEPVYVLGGYQTDFAKSWARNGQDISDMVKETTEGALENCLLEPSAIQSIHVGNAFAELQRQQAHLGSMVVQMTKAPVHLLLWACWPPWQKLKQGGTTASWSWVLKNSKTPPAMWHR